MDDPEFLRALNRYYKLKKQYETYLSSQSYGSLTRPKDPQCNQGLYSPEKEAFSKKKEKMSYLLSRRGYDFLGKRPYFVGTMW